MTKIVIIEDDPTINQMYRMKFEMENFTVRIADNGITGIKLVREFKPNIILLDLKMPEMDGAEALTKIRAHTWGKNIPVIVLTNVGEEEAPEIMKDLNITDYIVKANLTPRQVVAKVKAVLNN